MAMDQNDTGWWFGKERHDGSTCGWVESGVRAFTCGLHGVPVRLVAKHRVEVHVEASAVGRLLGGRGGREPWWETVSDRRGGGGGTGEASDPDTQENPRASSGWEEVNIQPLIKTRGKPKQEI